MVAINTNYLKLQASYLFSDIAKRVSDFQQSHPDTSVIKLGIGDVTKPLPPTCIEAMHRAVDEMAREESFRGYGPEQGYLFLREKIAEYDFAARGTDISPDEIFVSDGSKCDAGNIQEIFSTDVTVAIPDPVYPVYLDTFRKARPHLDQMEAEIANRLGVPRQELLAGLRIDLILTSDAMTARCTASFVDKEPRAWERPSDHAPVFANFDL